MLLIIVNDFSVGETALHKAARMVEQDEAAMMLCKALVDNGINLTVKSTLPASPTR